MFGHIHLIGKWLSLSISVHSIVKRVVEESKVVITRFSNGS